MEGKKSQPQIFYFLFHLIRNAITFSQKVQNFLIKYDIYPPNFYLLRGYLTSRNN